MTQFLFLAKIMAQCAVAALPGGLVLVVLYHWHGRRRKRQARERPRDENQT